VKAETLVKLSNNEEFKSFVKDLADRRDKLALDGVDLKDQIDRLRQDGRVQELKYILKQVDDARGNVEAIRKSQDDSNSDVKWF
jgi:hypothetical protein